MRDGNVRAFLPDDARSNAPEHGERYSGVCGQVSRIFNRVRFRRRCRRISRGDGRLDNLSGAHTRAQAIDYTRSKRFTIRKSNLFTSLAIDHDCFRRNSFAAGEVFSFPLN